MDGRTDGGWRDGGRREDGRGREGKEAGVTPASPSVLLPVIPGLRALDQRRRWLLVARQQSDGELAVSNSPSDTFKRAVCSSQLHADIAELLASAGPNPRRAVGGQSGSNDAASRHRATNTGSRQRLRQPHQIYKISISEGLVPQTSPGFCLFHLFDAAQFQS